MSHQSHDMTQPASMPQLPLMDVPTVSSSFKTMVDKTVDMNSNSLLDAAGGIAFDLLATGLRGVALYRHFIAKQNMHKIQKNMADKSSVQKFMLEHERFKSAKGLCGAAGVIGGVNNVWGVLRNTKTGNDMKQMTLANHNKL
jgi:hypothetical protein